MSASLLHLVVGIVLLGLIRDTDADQSLNCEGDSTYINISGIGACFAVMDVEEGPVSASEAQQKMCGWVFFCRPCFRRVQGKLKYLSPPPQYAGQNPVREPVSLDSKPFCENMARASGGGGGSNNMHPLMGGRQTEKLRYRKLNNC